MHEIDWAKRFLREALAAPEEVRSRYLEPAREAASGLVARFLSGDWTPTPKREEEARRYVAWLEQEIAKENASKP